MITAVRWSETFPPTFPERERPPVENHKEPLSLIEAPPRFELGIEDLQSSALPLGYGANTKGASSRDAAPQQGSHRAGNRTRTGDPHLGKVMLYQLSYSRKIFAREN